MSDNIRYLCQSTLTRLCRSNRLNLSKKNFYKNSSKIRLGTLLYFRSGLERETKISHFARPSARTSGAAHSVDWPMVTPGCRCEMAIPFLPRTDCLGLISL